MSPLARSLLALACATLLHASSADVSLPLIQLKLGIVDDGDRNIRKIALLPYTVLPTNSTTDLLISVPNKANKNEVLVGQNLAATDRTHTATRMTLTPLNKGQHSPLKLHCIPKCPQGVLINADQYVIKTIG